MTPYGFIYITTNLVNGKRYLGMCAYHCNNSNTYLGSGKALRRAIKKYGSQSFKRETIQECSDKPSMISAEIQWIDQLQCVTDPSWYNMNSGGYATKGFTGKKHSEETKAKMRQNYRRPMSESTRQKFKDNGYKRLHKLTQYRAENPDYQNKQIIFYDQHYPSIGECVKQTGLAWNTITRRIKNPPCAVMVYGTIYETINHAAKALGVSFGYVQRRLLDSSNKDFIPYQPEYRFL